MVAVELGGFTSDVIGNLIGAFAGVSLALLGERWTSRRLRREREAESRAIYADARSALHGSVVKNTAVAKRLKRLTASGGDTLLLSISFERSVWDATHASFLPLCLSVEERVVLARFFDDVARTQRLVEFYRSLRLAEGGARVDDPATAANEVMSSAAEGFAIGQAVTETVAHLANLAEDLRLSGSVIIADYGEPIHKQMMGISRE